MYRVSVDVGGTFTDLVALDEETGEVINIKTPSVPKNPEKGVVNAVEAFLGSHDADSVRMIGHATTIATNALFGQVDLDLPRTGLVTTKGFKDVIEIGRQRRAEVYNLFFERPPMLVKRRHRYEVEERIRHDGVVEQSISGSELDSVISRLSSDGVESVAVGLINSYANTVHEERVKQAIKERLDVYVTASHEISNEYREYERFSTAVVNAVLMPVIHKYINQLEENLASLGLRTQLYVMQSNGGLAKSNVVSRKPATIVESGPAAGVIAAAWLGEQTGVKNIISFDMGGTTAKAGTVRGKIPEVVPEYEVAGKIHMGRLVKGSGYPVRFPFIDLAECSAGGGTIAEVVNGALMVGPMSAGAVPGPACYGRGGVEATITDANLLLGRLNPGNLLDGAMDIHPGLAADAYKRLGSELGIGSEEAAVSVIRIANSMMSKILRIVSVERGYDPRDFALVAFGGAGPMHVCALAEELEINNVLVPPNPGMFSALGLLTADLFHDYSRPVLSDVTEVDADNVEMLFKEMLEEGRDTLDSEDVPRSNQSYKRTLDMRYRGQGFELNIETETPFKLESINKAVRDFHAKHTEVYGYAEEDEPVEVVNTKLRVIGLLESPHMKTGELTGLAEPRETRRVFFETDDNWHDVGIYDRSKLGAEAVGPAIIEQYDSTTVIYPDWSFKPDKLGNLILRRRQR
ncbi:MAG: hydantoinase/oxoprolinase family protein [Candidatus Bathyarchaeota archaeon]|nr:hydantoinase/oxoprolinase family protein [Candidatus Bathyarchaeota archaeon]